MSSSRDALAIYEDGLSPDRFKTAQTYLRLKDLLIFQNVPPRTRLDIGILARRLKVSKTPVREALIMLADERIIRAEPGRGYYSKPLDARELAEEYEVAFAMMKHIVGEHIDAFATICLKRPDAESLLATGQNLSNSVRPHVGLVEALLEEIAAAGGNRFSAQLVHGFVGRTTFIRELDLRTPGQLQMTMTATIELIDCLDRHNATAAVANLHSQYTAKVARLHHLVDQALMIAIKTGDQWEDLLH